MYLREICGREEGAPPPVDLIDERENGDFVRALILDSTASAAHDLSDGGLAVALAEMAMAGGIGATLRCRTRRYSGACLLVRRGPGALPRHCAGGQGRGRAGARPCSKRSGFAHRNHRRRRLDAAGRAPGDGHGPARQVRSLAADLYGRRAAGVGVGAGPAGHDFRLWARARSASCGSECVRSSIAWGNRSLPMKWLSHSALLALALERAHGWVFLDLTIFLVATFAGALVAGLSGICVRTRRGLNLAFHSDALADRDVDRRVRPYCAGFSVWKLRHALDWSKLWPFPLGAAIGVPAGVAILTWADPSHVRTGIGSLSRYLQSLRLASPRYASSDSRRHSRARRRA